MPESVAVFVPSYNHAPFIESCLRSIYAQSYPPTTLLVIDDGSTDNSIEIIERVLEECPFPAEFVVRPNVGLSATLNECLSRTTEPLIAYLGSDDCWHPDRLRAGVDALAADTSAVMAYGECFIIDGDDRLVGRACFNTEEGRRLSRGPAVECDLEGLFRFHTVPLSPTTTYRRQAVEKFGWNEASPLEDYEMYLLLASIGSFQYIPRPLGSWRLHGGNVSRHLAANLREVQDTQHRVAARLGISEKRLASYQSSARFVYGEYYLRSGRWTTGTALTLRNIKSARSVGALSERLLRVALPPRIVKEGSAILKRRSRRRLPRTK